MNITKDLLETLFEKDLSQNQLCKELNISKGRLKRLCIQYSLVKPHKSQKSFPKHFNKTGFITLQWLKSQYIDKNLTVDEISQQYQVSQKIIKNYLKEYQLVKSHEKFINKREEKRKQTCLEKYGVENIMQNDRIKKKTVDNIRKAYSSSQPIEKRKQTCLQRYQIESPIQLKEFKEKRYQTMKKNNSFNVGSISKAEEQAYRMLLEHFSRNDIERQYKTTEYPFPCDFFIKSLDLYIEYQGGQYHGKHPFDPTSKEDQARLAKLKQRESETKTKQKTVYTAMIRVWTKTDPYKREIARQNNLNFKEFWSIGEVKAWLEGLN